MAEIILAVLLIVAGLVCGLLGVIVLWASAMGGVTNASAVNNFPALWLAGFAVAGIAGGICMLVF